MSGTRPCNSNGNARVNNLQPELSIIDPNSREQTDILPDPLASSQGLFSQNPQNIQPYTNKIVPADPAYWNDASPPLSCQPFRPGNPESGPLPDAHYYHIVKDWPPADYLTKTNIPDPKYAAQDIDFEIDPKSLPNVVSRQSFERLKGSPLVKAMWKEAYTVKQGLDGYAANSLRGRTWKLSHGPNPVRSPYFFFRMYGDKPMTRAGISEGFEACKVKSDSSTKKSQSSVTTSEGPSGSLWGINQLNDLSCIPLLDLDMGIILPRGFNCAKVMSDINNCYIVKRILNEITVVTRDDLARFDRTHMSWYLFNPWCLFFTALRDHLARSNPVIEAEQLNEDGTQARESHTRDEDKDEASSEGLLHRFMEVILLLFSILCGGRDEWRSTPHRTAAEINVGKSMCKIKDDGYVYLTRGGTTGHKKREGINRIRATINKTQPLAASQRSRHGGEPIIRFEAKRMEHQSLPTAQIFAELLSAAVLNMEYLNEKVPTTQGNVLPSDLSSQPDEIPQGAEYHDAFVFHIEHYHLRIHTARFPTAYLKWVTSPDEPSDFHDVIVQKVTAPYDLSQPDDRLRAVRDILILLFAIRAGRTADPQGLFVARAVVPQTHKALAVPEPMNLE
ncbi:hypothetical protein BO82DRAFT_359739 [Aspergillus uvarum CBS 121591]|uniref:Uncharacterized protein n=1 Tax=Aspergillus uvarum CBS 121591 TaxID=1448315 RepID=A0A319CBA8_9EURO|nr:hypothetical protein BO82DRAFT_359739 [Aspergillus uvarum CBS 121591]PYH75803.1 hypothetical protein BO82DRAFT_359739 [Aspergillus uvarum CBS 121591]